MTRSRLCALLLAGSLVACAGTQKPADDIEQDPITYEDMPVDPGTEPTPDPTNGHLKIVAMKIDFGAGEGQEMVIRDDGVVIFGGSHVATVKDTGEMSKPDGALIARLNADGTLAMDTGDTSGLTIAEDGHVAKDGATVLSVGDDGAIIPPEGVSNIRLDGPPEGRRVAMFVLVVATMPATDGATEGATDGGDGDSSDPADPAEAPAPTAEASPDAP